MEEIRLKDICDLDNGFAFKSDDYVVKSNTLNCRMSNIRPDSSFDILYNAKYLPDEFAEKYKDYILYDGDLIIAMTDMAGDPKILGVPTVVNTLGYNLLLNQRVGKLRLIKKGVNADYLKLALQCSNVRNYLKKFAGGGVQLNVSKKDILSVPILMRSENEQNSIAEQFSKVLGLKEKREQELKLLDNLIKARFVEMFGEGLKDDGKFNLQSISEIGQVVSGATPKTAIDEYWDGDNLWITPAELSDETFIIYDSERKITYEGINSCAVNLLPIGTVILSSRAPIGKVAIAGTEMYCNQGFKNIIPNNSINSIYLYELLKMETKYLNSLGRGATFKEISKQIVESIKIKVPPIELQNQFATFVHQVDKSKVAVQKALDETQILFNSLMQKYFG